MIFNQDSQRREGPAFRGRRIARNQNAGRLFPNQPCDFAVANPENRRAAPPYPAMLYLHMHSKEQWNPLIRRRTTGLVPRPLVESTRLRNVRFRRRPVARIAFGRHTMAGAVLSAEA